MITEQKSQAKTSNDMCSAPYVRNGALYVPVQSQQDVKKIFSERSHGYPFVPEDGGYFIAANSPTALDTMVLPLNRMVFKNPLDISKFSNINRALVAIDKSTNIRGVLLMTTMINFKEDLSLQTASSPVVIMKFVPESDVALRKNETFKTLVMDLADPKGLQVANSNGIHKNGSGEITVFDDKDNEIIYEIPDNSPLYVRGLYTRKDTIINNHLRGAILLDNKLQDEQLGNIHSFIHIHPQSQKETEKEQIISRELGIDWYQYPQEADVVFQGYSWGMSKYWTGLVQPPGINSESLTSTIVSIKNDGQFSKVLTFSLPHNSKERGEIINNAEQVFPIRTYGWKYLSEDQKKATLRFAEQIVKNTYEGLPKQFGFNVDRICKNLSTHQNVVSCR